MRNKTLIFFLTVSVSGMSSVYAEESDFNNPVNTETRVSVVDNIIMGNGTKPNLPVMVTTISPSFETTNRVITSDADGAFEIKLNPTEKGEYQIYVTQDSNTTKTVYTVEDENKNLEIRLSLLQTLQKILEIIFGK